MKELYIVPKKFKILVSKKPETLLNEKYIKLIQYYLTLDLLFILQDKEQERIETYLAKNKSDWGQDFSENDLKSFLSNLSKIGLIRSKHMSKILDELKNNNHDKMELENLGDVPNNSGWIDNFENAEYC